MVIKEDLNDIHSTIAFDMETALESKMITFDRAGKSKPPNPV